MYTTGEFRGAVVEIVDISLLVLELCRQCNSLTFSKTAWISVLLQNNHTFKRPKYVFWRSYVFPQKAIPRFLLEYNSIVMEPVPFLIHI